MQRLKKDMEAASVQLQFEKAAWYRDKMLELNKLQNKANRLQTIFEKRNFFLFFRAFYEKECSVFYIADKYYVRIPKWMKEDAMISLLQKGYREFVARY